MKYDILSLFIIIFVTFLMWFAGFTMGEVIGFGKYIKFFNQNEQKITVLKERVNVDLKDCVSQLTICRSK